MKEYFDLDVSLLQASARWALPFTEGAVGLFASLIPADERPLLALEAMREFAGTGKRTKGMRSRAMDAYRASRDCADVTASLAANAASLGCAIAYTHPFRDRKQAEHILGPVVFAALALDTPEDPAETVITRAVASADMSVRALIREYPAQESGSTKAKRLYFMLDQGLRGTESRE